MSSKPNVVETGPVIVGDAILMSARGRPCTLVCPTADWLVAIATEMSKARKYLFITVYNKKNRTQQESDATTQRQPTIITAR